MIATVLADMAQTLGTMEFQWGKNIAGSTQSYESMLYNGIRYNLYDCAFIRSDLVEPHIGKLMRLYEEGGRPMIRVRWFFRAAELPSTMIKVLGQETLQEDPKELFIAQGNLKGVENENVVEVILGKARVLCTAKIPKNPAPSESLLENAHFFFNKAYDVSNKRLVGIERIDKSLASRFINKPEWLEVAEQPVSKSPTDAENVSSASPTTCNCSSSSDDSLQMLAPISNVHLGNNKKRSFSNKATLQSLSCRHEDGFDSANQLKRSKLSFRDDEAVESSLSET